MAISDLKTIKSALRKRRSDRPGRTIARSVASAAGGGLHGPTRKRRITYFNDAAAELWGRKPELGTNERRGSWRLDWPDGGRCRYDQCAMAVAA